MKLINMTDFVLEQNREPKSQNEQSRAFYYCCNYTKFIKQPLELWMFVPCDEDGNVFDAFVHIVEGGFSREYQEAKERCLFEGFEVSNSNDLKVSNREIDLSFLLNVIYLQDNCLEYPEVSKVLIIEDLVKYNLQLTQTAIKNLGL